MTPARASLVALVVATLASPRPSPGMGVEWQPQALRYPVTTSELRPTPPYVPPHIPEVRRAVEVGPERAAAVWLDDAKLLRVRALSRTATPLRFGRVIGTVGGKAGSARAVIEEPGIRPSMRDRENTWYLLQPPGRGGLWYIWAPSPTRVLVERPGYRRGRLIWEAVRDDVLDWIAHGGPMPRIPVVSSSDELELRLRTDEAIASALLRAYPASTPLRRALSAWRKASALVAMSAVRPALRPYMERRRIDDDWTGLGGEVALKRGADKDAPVVSRDPYRRLRADRATWDVVLEGPGVLHIEARAVLGSARGLDTPFPDIPSQPERELSLALTAGDALLGHDRGPAAPVKIREGSEWQHALGEEYALVAGDSLVSLKRQILVPLLEGTHTYRLTLAGGPALVRASVIRRRPRLLESLQDRSEPGDFIDRAEAQASRVREAPARGLLRLLVDELRAPLPRSLPSARRAELPPLLHLVALRSQSRRRRPSERAQRALAEELTRLMDQLPTVAPEADKLLEWRLRIQLARAFRRWRKPRHARALIDLDAGLSGPVRARLGGAVGRLLAEPPEPRPSVALRLAQGAWRERFIHPDRRLDLLSVWHRKTRWSLLSPSAPPTPAATPGPGEPVPAWTWLAPDVARTACQDAQDGGRAVASSAGLVYVPLATPCPVEIPALPSDPQRPARVRLHLFTPDDAPGPITVHIGEASWSTLAFERLEIADFAVPPGVHTVRVDGPPGTISLLELPSAFDELSRAGTPLRRRWPIHGPNHVPVHYDLPEHAGGSAIRVELREVVPTYAPQPTTPVRLRLRANTGWETRIEFTPGAMDPSILPLDAPGLLTMPLRFVVWLPPDARTLWLETDSNRYLVAGISIRRPAEPSPRRLSGPASPAATPATSPAAGAAPAPDAPAPTPAPASPAAAALPCAAEAATEPPASPLIARLYRLSRCLLQHPDRVPWRLERAELLLDLSRERQARLDLDTVAARQPSPSAAWYSDYRGLQQRLRERRSSTHLRPQPQPELFAKPTPIAPSLLALDAPAERLQAWVEPVATARTRGAAHALDTMEPPPDHDDAVAMYIHARLSRLAGRRDRAARVLLDAYLDTGLDAAAGDTGAWQLGLDALVDFNQVLEQPGAAATALAPLAHGLATRLGQTIEHVAVHRALARAGALSRRQTVRGVDAHAGYEWLYVDGAEPDPAPDPESLATWAWLAPPWPADQSRFIRPGRGARLSFHLTRPAAVWAEVWCRTRQGMPHPCRIEAWADQRKHVRTTAPAQGTEPAVLPRLELEPGDHVVEVVLPPGEDDVIASVRFVADRPIGQNADQNTDQPVPITFQRPSRMYVARDRKPITLAVAGPIVVRIEARTTADAPASTALLTATPLGAGAPTQQRIALDPTPDAAVRTSPDRPIPVTRAVETLLILPRPGAYRVAIQAPEGVVLARLATRIQDPATDSTDSATDPTTGPATDPTGPTAPGPTTPLAALPSHLRRAREGTPAPILVSAVDVQPAPAPPWRSHTYSAETGVGHDDFGAGDTPEGGAPRLDLALLLRRRAVPGRLWLGADLWTRTRVRSAWASGLRLAAHARRLPAGLRLDVRGDAAAQPLAGVWAWSTRGKLTVDRAIALGPALLVIPALSAELRRYSLDTLLDGHDLIGELDSRVYTDYGRDHARALEPRVSLYWPAFQDQAGLVTVKTRSNADLTSIDHISARAAWRGLIELGPRTGPFYELSYRVSRRFADLHRFQPYIRHDPGVSLQWPLWRGRAGRLLLDLTFRGYLARDRADQHHFRVGLRYDWTAGRGLVDLFPKEIDFDDFEEPRSWSPPR